MSTAGGVRSVVVSGPGFDGVWPFAADHLHRLWARQGPAELRRLPAGDGRPVGEVLDEPATVVRLAALGVPVTPACVRALGGLQEATFSHGYGSGVPEDAAAALSAAGVRLHQQTSEGFWGQSVAEFALGLTLCALRRIPQTHRQIITDHGPWDYRPPDGVGRPGARGQQFGDDQRFAAGTLGSKRVRVVGAGNVASRYASFAAMLGADVAAWDPYASEPCFHRAGARREWHLERLVADAEVFAPMLPLRPSTEGLVRAEHIDALPTGSLVVLVTRAGICDMPALRRRVLADELSLAADVHDREPLPLDDPLLGRHNVVHTPHNAGRTAEANREWARMLADQFRPR